MLAKWFWVRDFVPSYAVAGSKMVLGDLDHQGFGKIKWKLVYMCISYLYIYIYVTCTYIYIHTHICVWGSGVCKEFSDRRRSISEIDFCMEFSEKMQRDHTWRVRGTS